MTKTSAARLARQKLYRQTPQGKAAHQAAKDRYYAKRRAKKAADKEAAAALERDRLARARENESPWDILRKYG